MRHRADTRTVCAKTPGRVSALLAPEEARALVSPRAIPPVHRYRRHPSSARRVRDRSCDDDEEPYPHHDRGTETCSAGRDREVDGRVIGGSSTVAPLFTRSPRRARRSARSSSGSTRVASGRGLASPSRAYTVFPSPIEETMGLAGARATCPAVRASRSG
jgi:hypothetical protein